MISLVATEAPKCPKCQTEKKPKQGWFDDYSMTVTWQCPACNHKHEEITYTEEGYARKKKEGDHEPGAIQESV